MKNDPEKSKRSFFPPPNRDLENDTGWQVSYLDIITLLLATLIIILSVSQTQILSPISDYFQSTGETEFIFTPIEEIKTELEEQLQPEIDQGRISIVRELNDLRITFNSRRLYRPGEAALIPEARPLLNRVLNTLKATYQYDFNIDVEGHTDNSPIIESFYSSNWELSTARAANVVKYLSDLDVDENRLKASGYAYSRPLVPNEDSYGNILTENMEKNRRIVLRIYQDEDQLIPLTEQTKTSSFNSWELSDCFYSLQAGGYQSLHNAIRAAVEANENTGFDFQLSYNDNLFSIRSSNNIKLSEAIELQPDVSKQLESNLVPIVHQCDQTLKWLHYQIQLGYFKEQENALRFVGDLQNNYNIDGVISQAGDGFKVLTRSLSDLQTANNLLAEIKKIEPLSNSYITFDPETVRDYRFEYHLQMASFRSEVDATQFSSIITNELGLTPEVQPIDSNFVVVQKFISNWDQLLNIREEIDTYTNNPSIVHLTEISGYRY